MGAEGGDALIWSITDAPQLIRSACEAVAEPTNTVLVNAASA